MQLVTYRASGTECFGAVVGDGVIPYRPASADAPRSVREVLERGLLDEVASATSGRDAEIALDDVEFLPPVVPRKILCVGLNYVDHRHEAGRSSADYPTIFTRFADAHVGHDQQIVRPSVSDMLDYEGELAVVVGGPVHRATPDAAMDSVAGYACYNDFTVRDWQRHTHQWTPGKNFVGVGSFGPCLVTADEVGDTRQLDLETRVNGEVRQSGSVSDLIFDIPKLIAYLSTFTPLAAGDVIATGTPGGVGFYADPPVFLQPDDVVEVEISSVGLLRNTIVV